MTWAGEIEVFGGGVCWAQREGHSDDQRPASREPTRSGIFRCTDHLNHYDLGTSAPYMDADINGSSLRWGTVWTNDQLLRALIVPLKPSHRLQKGILISLLHATIRDMRICVSLQQPIAMTHSIIEVKRRKTKRYLLARSLVHAVKMLSV